jgi:hypothetical protein
MGKMKKKMGKNKKNKKKTWRKLHYFSMYFRVLLNVLACFFSSKNAIFIYLLKNWILKNYNF